MFIYVCSICLIMKKNFDKARMRKFLVSCCEEIESILGIFVYKYVQTKTANLIFMGKGFPLTTYRIHNIMNDLGNKFPNYKFNYTIVETENYTRADFDEFVHFIEVN